MNYLLLPLDCVLVISHSSVVAVGLVLFEELQQGFASPDSLTDTLQSLAAAIYKKSLRSLSNKYFSKPCSPTHYF